MKSIFENIYQTNSWKDHSSGTASGPGSSIECSKIYLDFLTNFVEKYKIKSILDLGCGDFNLMRHFNFTNINYLGVDIVSSVIKLNNISYAKENIIFLESNLLTFKPTNQYDLVLIKDVLQHLSINNINFCIKNIDYAKYIMLTNDYTFTNVDCIDGGYRPLNLHNPPYSINNIESIFQFDSCGFLKNVDLINLHPVDI